MATVLRMQKFTFSYENDIKQSGILTNSILLRTVLFHILCWIGLKFEKDLSI